MSVARERIPIETGPEVPPPAVRAAADEAEWDFVETVERLWRARRRLAILAIAGAAAGLMLALLLPPTFVATVQFAESAPPRNESMLDRPGGLAGALDLAVGGASPAALTFPEVLRSRRLLERLLERPVRPRGHAAVPLLDVLLPRGSGPERVERGTLQLRRRMDVAFDRKSGVFTVRVRSRDPQVAADVANGASDVLQEIVRASRADLSRATARFLEGRIAAQSAALAAAEQRVRSFREENLRYGNAPRLQIEEARVRRDVLVNEQVLMGLRQRLEVARLGERTDVPVLDVFAPASPPALRSAPRRALLVAAGAIVGLVLAAALALAPPAPWRRLRRVFAA